MHSDLLSCGNELTKTRFINNWEDMKPEEAWEQEELALIIFIAVMYIILLIWVSDNKKPRGLGKLVLHSFVGDHLICVANCSRLPRRRRHKS